MKDEQEFLNYSDPNDFCCEKNMFTQHKSLVRKLLHFMKLKLGRMVCYYKLHEGRARIFKL